MLITQAQNLSLQSHRAVIAPHFHWLVADSPIIEKLGSCKVLVFDQASPNTLLAALSRLTISRYRYIYQISVLILLVLCV